MKVTPEKASELLKLFRKFQREYRGQDIKAGKYDCECDECKSDMQKALGEWDLFDDAGGLEKRMVHISGEALRLIERAENESKRDISTLITELSRIQRDAETAEGMNENDRWEQLMSARDLAISELSGIYLLGLKLDAEKRCDLNRKLWEGLFDEIAKLTPEERELTRRMVKVQIYGEAYLEAHPELLE